MPNTATPDAVKASWITSSPLVAFTVTRSAAASPPPPKAAWIFDVHFRGHLRWTGSVIRMVSAPPNALNVMCSTCVVIHDHRRNVSREGHAAAVRRNIDLLGDVGAAERQRVDTGLTFERVVVVAGLPHEGNKVVRALIVTSLPSPPEMRSSPSPAEELLGTQAAIHRELHGARFRMAGVDHVIATLGLVSTKRSFASVKNMFTSAVKPNTLTPPVSPATPSHRRPGWRSLSGPYRRLGRCRRSDRRRSTSMRVARLCRRDRRQ